MSELKALPDTVEGKLAAALQEAKRIMASSGITNIAILAESLQPQGPPIIKLSGSDAQMVTFLRTVIDLSMKESRISEVANAGLARQADYLHSIAGLEKQAALTIGATGTAEFCTVMEGIAKAVLDGNRVPPMFAIALAYYGKVYLKAIAEPEASDELDHLPEADFEPEPVKQARSGRWPTTVGLPSKFMVATYDHPLWRHRLVLPTDGKLGRAEDYLIPGEDPALIEICGTPAEIDHETYAAMEVYVP